MKLTCLSIVATFPLAASADHGEHRVQALYRAEPCVRVLAAIESQEQTIDALAEQAMAWGYLLAIDALHPDAKGGHHTLLQRLRTDCASSPELPAADLLRSYFTD